MDADSRGDGDRLRPASPPHFLSPSQQAHPRQHAPDLHHAAAQRSPERYGRHQRQYDPDNDNNLNSSFYQQTPAHPTAASVPAPHAELRSLNSRAVAANATVAAAPFPSSVRPDDFYRDYYYRGVQPADAVLLPEPFAKNSMASAIPTSRLTPSSRPNGNGTTAKHPAAPPNPNGLRPAFRSVSNPVDDRLAHANARSTSPAMQNGYGGSSVKDLKKKFDQTTSSPSSTLKKAPPRNFAGKDTPPGTSRVRSPEPATGKPSYAPLRPTPTRELSSDSRGSGPRAAQRPKPAAGEQASSNTQSFASRINRPRDALSSNAHASRSATTLSSERSPESTAPTSPDTARSNGLLFGEIRPEHNNSQTAGFGIEGTRSRSTSESHLPSTTRARHVASPQPDLEPASPTDWYRAGPPSSSLQPSFSQSDDSRIPRSHNRGRSEHAAGSNTTPRRQQYPPPSDQDQPTSPLSRHPRTLTKLNSPPSRGSPASTRSNSPSATRRPANSSRPSRQTGPAPVTRAKTPTKYSATSPVFAATSQAPGSSGRKAPTQTNNTTDSSRLNAYVALPPPKLSPPLRSSRPRQSVSTATTASSRLKMAGRSPSPNRNHFRVAGKTMDDDPKRRRKISVGPIDFAQRRETIKLAYSKSIRESQAREARQVAADRRKKELEAVARAKTEAEAVATAVIAASADRADAASRLNKQKYDGPLKITTNMPILSPPQTGKATGLDSPTLGIPGSFPSIGSPPLGHDDTPQSAVSTGTAVTEFDIDPQTEPPTQESTAAIDADLGISLPWSRVNITRSDRPPSLQKRSSYQYPFADEGPDDESVSIKISLDATSAQSSPQLEVTPTRTEFDLDTSIPGSYRDEYETRPYTYTSQSQETTIRLLGPETTFTPSAPMARIDENAVNGQTSPIIPGQYVPDDDSPLSVAHRTEETADAEAFYAGPSVRSNASALRVSTTSPRSNESALVAPTKTTPASSHSLTLPLVLSPAGRSSQTSAWTDFSFQSNDDHDPADKLITVAGREVDVRSRRSPRHDQDPNLRDSAYENSSHSPEISPHDATTTLPPIRPSSLQTKHQLPEIDTGAGFALIYQSVDPHRGDSSPLPPSYAPPLPPDEYDLDQDAFYHGTRPSSYLHLEDENEELVQPLSTPQSGQVLLDASDSQTATLVGSKLSVGDVQGPTDKEQKRLRQRQMVIKELIDTESIFVRDMSVVEEIYKGTAEACPKLDGKTVKIIFRNTDEIINFHTTFLAQLKEGVSSVYVAKGRRSPLLAQESSKDSKDSDAVTLNSNQSSGTSPAKIEPDSGKDRQTSIGPVFSRNVEQMKTAHEGYLRSSDLATKHLIRIQEDATVKVWLSECNEVAKDLTTAWNLDSLLIKPMQRLTKYPNLISQLLDNTPPDHPDREALVAAKTTLENAILDINKTKKNFELVGQIVGRKRKESEVRAGLARAFGKRTDKLQPSTTKTSEDDEYLKLHEKFGDDYLRLQVVLRDVEYYTRTVSTYVHEFLQYLSSMELVMRLQPSKNHGHLESKWVQFNVGMRDIEKVLEQHLLAVRRDVIEPFEQVIRCYGNPSLAMKKRSKRRLDYDKYLQLKAGGKKIDKQLSEQVEQYEALNDSLKKELPKLSALTAKIGNICLCKFVAIQTTWFGIWKEKVKVPLQDPSHVPQFAEIISAFQTDFNLIEEEALNIGILNPSLKGRASQSTTDDVSPILTKARSRPAELASLRSRGLSAGDGIPTLPTPDVLKRHSGQFALSPALPSPNHSYYRDYYAGINGYTRGASSPITLDILPSGASRPIGGRPSTGRSMDSGSGAPRPSIESHNRRDSSSTYNSPYGTEQRRFSGLFHSAMPPADAEEGALSSRASSRERNNNSGYNVLWLAASLFEFNIETTKHEAGYPYLTYQAGEIFDVIAEKGELWLAKNQDDPRDQVGWIWSKHFAKLADS